MKQLPILSGDVRIQLHRSRWFGLPEETKLLLALYVGPMAADENGMLTFTITKSRWEEIRATLKGIL